MHRHAVGAVVLTAAAVLIPATGAGGTKRFQRDGIAFEYPSRWFVSVAPLSNAVNPRYRFTVSTSAVRRTRRDSGPCLPGVASQLTPAAVLAYLREALGPDRARSLPGMQPRPRRFRLPTASDNALCGFGPGGRWIPFKERGRAFYLGLYACPRATVQTRRALSFVVDRMQISPR
jgi:hypothetical protein